MTFIGNTAYALVSEVSSDLNYLDPSLDLHDIDGIYRIDGPDRFTIVANIGAWSIANPPPPGFDLVVFSGVQFSFLPYGDGFVVNEFTLVFADAPIDQFARGWKRRSG